jgi:hypothetical protein
MSGNIRIGQSLREGYNPDGLPGTVSLGVGAPGRPPTSAELLAAVEEYIAAHPVGIAGVNATDAESFKIGTGALGAAGAYLEIGTFGTVDTRVAARSQAPTVNLYLEATGQVITNDLRVDGSLTIRDDFVLQDQTIHLRGPGSAEALSFHQNENAELTGTRLSTGVSGDLTVSNADHSDQVTVLRWSAGAVWTTGRSYALSVGDVAGNFVTAPLSGMLTEVRALPAVSYRNENDELRRNLPWEQLNDDIVNTGYLDMQGVVATLWSALRELDAKRKIGGGNVSVVSGNFTVTHNLGSVPTGVFIQARTAGAVDTHRFAVTAATSTTFTARVFYNGAVLSPDQTISIYWRVEAA